MDTDEPGLVARAKGLTPGAKGWPQELADLAVDISAAFPDDGDDPDVRAACEHLLQLEQLPSLRCAQFLVYMACSENDGDYDAMIQRLEDAQTHIEKTTSKMHEQQLEDPRVARLREGITIMYNKVVAWKADAAEALEPDELKRAEVDDWDEEDAAMIEKEKPSSGKKQSNSLKLGTKQYGNSGR